MTVINDVQVGQSTRINIGSRHYGRKRVPLAGTLAITPKETSGVIPEFDNEYPVMVWHVFDSCDVKFEAPLADQTDIEAMIYDMDPASAYMYGFNEAMKSYNVIWVNYTGKNLNYLYAGEWTEFQQCHQSDSTTDLKSPSKRSYAFTGGRHIRVASKFGSAPCGIQYTRFVYQPAYTTTDDATLSGTGQKTGTFPYAPQTFIVKGGAVQTTAQYIQCYKNGLPYTNFTITGTALALGDVCVAGDVVEFWTVAAANVS